MSLGNAQVAADGSDIVVVQYVQTNGTPSGASETLNVRGFATDQAALLSELQIKNTMTGNFTGNH